MLFTVKATVTHPDNSSDVSSLGNAGMQLLLCPLEGHPARLLAPYSTSDCAAMSLRLFSVSPPCQRKAAQDASQAYFRCVILICFTKHISTLQKLFPKFNPMSQTIPGIGKCPTCQTRISAQLKAGEENGQQPVTQQELVFPCPLLDSNACETLSSSRKHRGENACHSIQWKGCVCAHDFHGIQVHSELSMKLWHQPGSNNLWQS